MAVAEGRNGLVTVAQAATSAGSTDITVAELGTWSIGGISRNMIDITAFGDTVMKYAPGMMNPGTITFSGFCDAGSVGQAYMIEAINNGYYICNKTTAALLGNSSKICRLKLWANDDTGQPEYGFWSCSGSSGKLFFNSMDTAQDKNGVASISFTAQVSHGALAWSTIAKVA